MTTKTQQSQARAEERRRRKQVKADRRRRDRALAAVVVAGRLGIPVADLARAMRAAGVAHQLTEAQAKGWISDPDTAPEWFTTLLGERLARAAEVEYRRQRAEEQRQLRQLAVEQSALAKVQAGKRRFSDAEWVFVHDWAFRAAKDLVRDGPEGEAADFDRQVLGGINWSSQHLDLEVCDGTAKRVGGGSDGTACDAIAGPASGGTARASATVLEGDR